MKFVDPNEIPSPPPSRLRWALLVPLVLAALFFWITREQQDPVAHCRELQAKAGSPQERKEAIRCLLEARAKK